MTFELPTSISKKVDKEISAYYEMKNYTLDRTTFSDSIINLLPTDFKSDNFLKINSEEKLLGYAYIGMARSKADSFDYLILFDSNLVIIKSKVLIYREDYGGEIGSKRWLKQFVGKSLNDELNVGQNIKAISGATISVNAMTTAVNNVLKSVKILIEHKKL